MVDVLKSLDVEYLTMNCASSFRGLQEAVINYGGNKKPEIINCPHEDIAVHMAQGYAKIEGKPIAMIGHGVVGIQHATMAMYNAWCDRVPMIVMGGNIMEANKRAPGAEWVHSAVDINQIVREFTKWDDQPASLQHFAESAVRAYKISVTPPMGPVMLALDAELQENPIPDRDELRIPKLATVIPPQGDAGALAEAAKMLVAAENPVIICDRVARTPAGMSRLVELAETLQCAVVDNAGRMNFPSRHPLNQSFRRGVIGQADVILAIEMNDLWGALNTFNDRINRSSRSNVKKGAKLITLGVRDLYLKGNYQDFGRYEDTDLNIAGDGEASLPALTEAVKRLVDEGRKAAFEARGKKFAASHLAMVNQSKIDATIGWDSSPITTARMAAEVYAQIKDEDWSLVGNAIRNTWPHRLWDIKKSYQWNGGSGGAGVGYNLPASLGAALANKKHGRFTVVVRRRRRLHVQSRHAVDGGASPDPDALHHPQQPRLPSGVHVPRGDGGAARTRRRQGRHRHHDQGSQCRLRHRRARHGRAMARARSSIRRTSRRRSSAPSPRSRPASRRWSTSSPIRVEEQDNEKLRACIGHGRCRGRSRRRRGGDGAGAGCSARRCRQGQAGLPQRSLLHLPRPCRAGRCAQRARAASSPRRSCRSTASRASFAIRRMTCRPMPEVILSDQQVADIYAYLQTLSGPTAAKDIPAILNN